MNKMQLRTLLKLVPRQPQLRRPLSNQRALTDTLDDLPQPSGSWQAHYDKNQVKYTRQLILGTLVLGATLAFGQVNGYHEFYNDIPEKPLDIQMYK